MEDNSKTSQEKNFKYGVYMVLLNLSNEKFIFIKMEKEVQQIHTLVKFKNATPTISY